MFIITTVYKSGQNVIYVFLKQFWCTLYFSHKYENYKSELLFDKTLCSSITEYYLAIQSRHNILCCIESRLNFLLHYHQTCRLLYLDYITSFCSKSCKVFLQGHWDSARWMYNRHDTFVYLAMVD